MKKNNSDKKKWILKKGCRITQAISSIGLIACLVSCLLMLFFSGLWESSGWKWFCFAGIICSVAMSFCGIMSLVGFTANQCVRCVAYINGYESIFFRQHERPSALKQAVSCFTCVTRIAGARPRINVRSHRRASRPTFARASGSSGDNSDDGGPDQGDLPASSASVAPSASPDHPQNRHHNKMSSAHVVSSHELLLRGRRKGCANMTQPGRETNHDACAAFQSTQSAQSDHPYFMRRELPEIKWAIDSILPAGLSILIGRPKIGRRLLTIDFAQAVATGSMAFGKISTEAGCVLYLALDDTERRLQQRIKMMGYTEVCSFAVNFVFGLSSQYEDGLGLIEAWLKNHPQARLVVIDNLRKFHKQCTPNANSYDGDYDTLSSVKALADKYEVSVLFVHHERKTRDAKDFINNASGSAAITEVPDCLLFLERARLQGLGKLNVIGRDVEEREYALSLSGMKWRLESDAEGFAVIRDKRRILDYLRENGETLLKELADALEIQHCTMSQKLLRMDKDGVICYNSGKYGIPGSDKDEA